MKKRLLTLSLALLTIAGCKSGKQTELTGVEVSLSNPLEINRSSETIEIDVSDIYRKKPELFDQPLEVRVLPEGKIIPSQITVEAQPKLLVQLALSANESKQLEIRKKTTITPEATKPQVPYGRFVPERQDDFTWENDKIAYRIYGPEGQRKDGPSVGIDVWAKRVEHSVIDNWYQKMDYHTEHGEGLDFYKVGPSLGAGGIGLFKDGQLHTSNNFINWKVLDAGPIRFTAQFTYPPMATDKGQVQEIKTISLDKGAQLNRFSSVFEAQKDWPLEVAVGLHKHKKIDVTEAVASDNTWISLWSGTYGKQQEHGELGTGAVFLTPISHKNEKQHSLAVTQLNTNDALVYYAGAGWNFAGEIQNAKDWQRYLDQQAKQLASPVQVQLN